MKFYAPQAALVFVGLLFACTVHAQYNCSDILKDGVRNTYRELRQGDLKSSFSSKYCASSRKNEDAGSNTNLGVDYTKVGETFGFDFGTSDKRTLRKASDNCGGSTSGLSDDRLDTAMASVVDQSIVKAWQECVTRPVGLAITGRTEENALSIYVFFRSAGSIGSTKLTSNPSFSGATCPANQLELLKNGSQVNTGGVRLLCTRDGDGPVVMIVNSEFGPAELVIPREERIVEVKASAKPSEIPTTPNVPHMYVCEALYPAAPGALPRRCPTSPAPDGQVCMCSFPDAIFTGRTVDLAKPIAAPGGAPISAR